MKKLLLALTLVLSSTAFAAEAKFAVPYPTEEVAAEAPISPERPAFTNSTTVVGKGNVVVEGGYTNFRLNGVKTETYGEVLVRYGISPRLELRVAGNSYQVTKATGFRVSGLQDSNVGLKYAVRNGETSVLRPNIAVIVQTSVPTGARNFSSNSYQPGVQALLGWNLSDKTALNAGMGYTRADIGSTRSNRVSQSVVLSHAATDKVGVFVEAFNINTPGTGGATSFAQTGVTYRVTNEFQVDARVGKGLNAGKADFFGVGGAYRF